MIQAVIFDMDGVLVNSEPFYQQRRLNFLQEQGRDTSALPDMTGSNEKAIWETIEPQDAALRETLKLRYRDYQRTHPEPYAELANPDAAPLLRQLHAQGLRIAIASSSAADRVQAMTQALGITPLVEQIVSGEDCPRHKPAPDVYLRTLSLLGLPAEQAVAVEDSPTGIAAARAAGLYTYALCPLDGSAPPRSNANAQLSRLRELWNVLQGAQRRREEPGIL